MPLLFLIKDERPMQWIKISASYSTIEYKVRHPHFKGDFLTYPSTNYSSDPGDQGAFGGVSPLNGGTGGLRYDDGTDEGGDGGFGGGGGGGSDNMGCGGGGGYSGGGGGNNDPENSCGGGSFSVSEIISSAENSGHGYLSIRLITE